MNEDIKVNWVFSPSFPLTFLNSHNFGARPPPDSLCCDPLIRPTLPLSLSREREDENVWYSLPPAGPRVRCITISQSLLYILFCSPIPLTPIAAASHFGLTLFSL